MANNILANAFAFILPKKKSRAGGSTVTNTYKAGNANTLSLPAYQDFLEDIQESRVDTTEIELVDKLFLTDPDCSAALNAYITLSDTPYMLLAYNEQGELDRDGIKLAEALMYQLFNQTDYSLGYQMKRSFREFKEQQGWLLLSRGSIGGELVFNKSMQPDHIRIVDMATVKFREKSVGEYKPVQKTNNSDEIELDIPTFFTSSFRQAPTSPYSHSFFGPAINTIASRAKMIEDLYRIMNYTGYPRIEVKVLEQVLLNSCPKDIAGNVAKKNEWIRTRLQELSNQFVQLRPTSPIVHTDSCEVSIINDRMSGASLQIKEIIDTLNAQNQAGLKVVATVLGRGTAGVNTASTETIIFSKHADAFNRPFEDMMSNILTLAMRMQGYAGRCELHFAPVELRPELELENQKTMLQTRLLQQLSYGLITDDYFALRVNGRLSEEGAPQLSGTNFLEDNESVNTNDPNANTSPLNRALTPDNETSSKSNAVAPEKDK